MIQTFRKVGTNGTFKILPDILMQINPLCLLLYHVFVRKQIINKAVLGFNE